MIKYISFKQSADELDSIVSELNKYTENSTVVNTINSLVGDVAIHNVGYTATEELRLSYAVPCKITVTKVSDEQASVELDF